MASVCSLKKWGELNVANVEVVQVFSQKRWVVHVAEVERLSLVELECSQKKALTVVQDASVHEAARVNARLNVRVVAPAAEKLIVVVATFSANLDTLSVFKTIILYSI